MQTESITRRRGQRIFPPLPERFWSRVHKAESCWLWTGHRDKDGYGILPYDGKLLRAHRVSWELHNGPIPAGIKVLHSCDTPPCVNPAHLFAGTQRRNIEDMIAKGRGRYSDRHGERNSAAKLSECDVLTIRAEYAAGGVTHADLAAGYGVCATLIGLIVRRERWGHLD
jgi:hypothetical protein